MGCIAAHTHLQDVHKSLGILTKIKKQDEGEKERLGK